MFSSKEMRILMVGLDAAGKVSSSNIDIFLPFYYKLSGFLTLFTQNLNISNWFNFFLPDLCSRFIRLPSFTS